MIFGIIYYLLLATYLYNFVKKGKKYANGNLF